MMDDEDALKVAIELWHVPSRVRLVRSRPLPADVSVLLRIVAGDQQEWTNAATCMDRSRTVVRDAAVFFIEQILLSPDADSYRVLGATAAASAGELRANMACLLSWLHPDREGQGERAVFAHRVTKAWNDLKTAERRAAYDVTRASAAPGWGEADRTRKRRSARNGGRAGSRSANAIRHDGRSLHGFIRAALVRAAGPGLFRRAWAVFVYGRKR